MKRPEQEIQAAIVSHLNLRAEPKTFWWSTPNEGKRGFAAAAALKRSGLTAGVPDLLILKDGRLHGLEIKAPGGRLTPSQVMVLERMQYCGAQVAVAFGLDEALITLECWGILKRNANKETAA